MPVSDKKQAGIFMLQPDPVLEYPVVMTKVKRAGWAHAR